MDGSDDDGAYFYGAPGRAPSARPRGVAPADDGIDEARFLGELAQAMSASLAISDLEPVEDAAVAARGGAGRLPPPAPSYAAVATAVGEPAPAPAPAPQQLAPAPRVLAPKDSRPLCTYFQSGACRYGSGCRFRHAAADPAAVDFFEARILALMEADRGRPPPPLPLPAAGGGDGGRGGEAASPAEAAAAEASFSSDAEAWLASGTASRAALIEAAVASGLAHDAEDAETALAMAERNVSRDISCSVCLEPVTAEPGRRFGLLTSCTHAFCLDCIRQWRGRIDLPVETTRRCPVCRTLSFYVVPCDRFIADEGRKAVESSAYHGAQRQIPCRAFNYGKGTCAFGSSCFFAHLNADGTPAVLIKHVVRVDSEGNVGVGRKAKLSEFLFK